MKHKKEFEQIGCRVLTEGGTGLKVSVSDGRVVLLHMTHTGMSVGSAELDVKNTRRLVEELERAIEAAGNK